MGALAFFAPATHGFAQQLDEPVVIDELDWVTRLLGGLALPDGSVLLVDRTSPVPHLYSSRGALLARIGRRGQGPGEMTRAWPAGIIGDTLWILDLNQRRVNYFARSGAFYRSERLPAPAASLSDLAIEPRWVTPSHNFISKESATTLAISGRQMTSISLVHTSAGGEILNKITDLKFGDRAVLISLPSGSIYQVNQPWSWDDLEAIDPKGAKIAVVRQREVSGEGQVTVELLDPYGERYYSRDLSLSLEELTSRTVDNWVARLYEGISGHVQSIEVLRKAVAEAFSPPRFIPPVSRVVISSDEVVWLEHAPGEWTTLSPTGTVSRVTATLPVRLIAASSSMAWGEMRDDLDVTRVFGYKIPEDLIQY